MKNFIGPMKFSNVIIYYNLAENKHYDNNGEKQVTDTFS